VEAFIFGVQVVMTYVGGKWLRTVGLHFSEWMTVTLLALTIIPFDLLRKVVIVPYLKRKRLGHNLRSVIERPQRALFHDFV
jgi:branched-subunit amino acid ABC-type transport system permease component